MRVNAMHLNEPFSRMVGGIEKIFILEAGFGVFLVHPCAPSLFLHVSGFYLSIISSLLVFWMNQMHMDEPISNFKRVFEFARFLVLTRCTFAKAQKCIQVHLVHRNGGVR